MTQATKPVSNAPAAARWSPGSLVRARGREWIVLGGSTDEVLRVRPITGSEEDRTVIHRALEAEPVSDASFPLPTADDRASHEASLLLRDALVLSLRRGAGPFRSFGQIAIEPRAYQLVPLLMALELDPVRLLIADDVGIGKTIEGGLIARELYDRGDIERFTVLCPPHLVEQWVSELEQHFHLRAVPVTAASAGRLERSLPPGVSLFSAHPFTVVSLDYIKSERRRDEFARACPELVLVDEAHTCAAAGQGRHQRYELLRALSRGTSRHLVMLTATPHSGDEQAFYRLLGLLDPEFERLEVLEGKERDKLRERLARHFVQRRRPDIADWKEQRLFPERKTSEITYRLSGAWQSYFDAVLDHCAERIEKSGASEREQRLGFWGTLALMRCVASSPAAAIGALRTRAGLASDAEADEMRERLFDGDADSLVDDDVEPPAGSEQATLAKLIAEAEALLGLGGDPKLVALTKHLEELLAEGHHPVVFCRYIATARYLAEQLAAHLGPKHPELVVEVITGELGAEERRERVDALGEAEARLLVATDCLSEGINLQGHLDAVVHYDLSWNPTRHEQREGRVDRFGQKRDVVRATLLYGANNPVDGAVLEVILRKAEKIRLELGVPVPLPDEGHSLSQALLKAVLLRKSGRRPTQQAFDFMQLDEAKELDARWEGAAQRAKKNRTVFAQQRLKPEQVLPEWRKSLSALGGRDDVFRFTGRALARLGGGLDALGKGTKARGYKAPLDALPADVRERLDAEGLGGTVLVDFDQPPAPSCRSVSRSHPLVSVLAETLLERTLSGARDATPDPALLGRVGCWVAEGVTARTVVVLLRLRHQLTLTRPQRTTTLLVEEATALAWPGSGAPLEGAEALALLEPAPLADPPLPVRERSAAQALALVGERQAELSAYAERRAQALLDDHRRVRDAAHARGAYAVRALLPADVVAVYVLLPKVG